MLSRNCRKLAPLVLFMLVIVPILQSCSGLDSEETGGRFYPSTPRFFQLRGLPQGDDSYSQGVRDGCTQAHGLVGSGMLRTHGFAYDPNRGIKDEKYHLGYQIGSRYCTLYIDDNMF